MICDTKFYFIYTLMKLNGIRCRFSVDIECKGGNSRWLFWVSQRDFGDVLTSLSIKMEPIELKFQAICKGYIIE